MANTLDTLPTEVLETVLSHLDADTLIYSIPLVSQRLQQVARHSKVIYQFYTPPDPCCSALIKNHLSRELYRQNLKHLQLSVSVLTQFLTTAVTTVCHNLQKLTIVNCGSSITYFSYYACVEPLLRVFPTIRVLSFDDTTRNSTTLTVSELLLMSDQVFELQKVHPKICSSEDMKKLTTLPSLSCISLISIGLECPEDFERLSEISRIFADIPEKNLPKLKLEVSQRTSGKTLEATLPVLQLPIRNLTAYLKVLVPLVDYINYTHEQHSQESSKVLKRAKQVLSFSTLTQLRFQQLIIDDVDFSKTYLQEVQCNGYCYISTAALESLICCESLTNLDLGNTQILSTGECSVVSEEYSRVARCNLQELTVHDSEVFICLTEGSIVPKVDELTMLDTGSFNEPINMLALLSSIHLRYARLFLPLYISEQDLENWQSVFTALATIDRVHITIMKCSLPTLEIFKVLNTSRSVVEAFVRMGSECLVRSFVLSGHHHCNRAELLLLLHELPFLRHFYLDCTDQTPKYETLKTLLLPRDLLIPVPHVHDYWFDSCDSDSDEDFKLEVMDKYGGIAGVFPSSNPIQRST